jgi:hypothetical protein
MSYSVRSIQLIRSSRIVPEDSMVGVGMGAYFGRKIIFWSSLDGGHESYDLYIMYLFYNSSTAQRKLPHPSIEFQHTRILATARPRYGPPWAGSSGVRPTQGNP